MAWTLTAGLLHSFAWMPIGTAALPPDAQSAAASALGQLFVTALAMAGPVLAVSLAVDALGAVLGKAASPFPLADVLTGARPLVTAGALGLAALALQPHLEDAVRTASDALEGIARAGSPHG
jgi:flagellar biosynthetic protein FliR